jgi:hypothetical protein
MERITTSMILLWQLIMKNYWIKINNMAKKMIEGEVWAAASQQMD